MPWQSTDLHITGAPRAILVTAGFHGSNDQSVDARSEFIDADLRPRAVVWTCIYGGHFKPQKPRRLQNAAVE